MANLLDELDALGHIEDDNFIYFDEHGNPELKHELLFKWNLFPSKVFRFTFCLSYFPNSDSLTYVKTNLYMSLEKYSIFLSLKHLRIVNLSNSKELLPEVRKN
jgi:hypothetical protein